MSKLCKLYSVVLGDIMGYDGHKCYNCPHRIPIKKGGNKIVST